MRDLLLAVFVLGALPVGAAGQIRRPAYLSQIEYEIILEQNLARNDPGRYADLLQATRDYYDGLLLRRPGMVAERTHEGIAALDEAISFLRSQQPVRLLESSFGLSMGARDHVADQGPLGLTGHVGSDSSMVWDRVNRYGEWTRAVAENIAYGPDFVATSARMVVSQLVIDDGIAGRGHRDAVFEPGFRYAGVSCGVHLIYSTMCVLTYASRYREDR